jgi:hypothetical protein
MSCQGAAIDRRSKRVQKPCDVALLTKADQKKEIREKALVSPANAFAGR